MMKKNIHKKMAIVFMFLFFVVLSLYFVLRDSYDWVRLILPEFLGVTLISLIILLAFKKSWSIKQYSIFLISIFSMGVILLIIGQIYNNMFLTDLSPELLGSTLIGALFGIIFKRKVSL
jgi:hypothetical protein